MTSKDEAMKNPIDMNEDGSESEDDGSFVPIYRIGQGNPPEDLVDFSTKAITKYNHKKGCTYMFVELVEGLLFANCVTTTVVTTFKARQTDDGMIMTFRASTDTTASKYLSDPNLHIKVAPVLPDSGGLVSYSSDSESEYEYESESEYEYEYEYDEEFDSSGIDKPEILGAQVKLLEIDESSKKPPGSNLGMIGYTFNS